MEVDYLDTLDIKESQDTLVLLDILVVVLVDTLEHLDLVFILEKTSVALATVEPLRQMIQN